MNVTTYLSFNQNAEKALEKYRQVFHISSIQTMKYKDMPNFNGPDNMKELILHSEFFIGETKLHASDTPSSMKYVEGTQTTLTLTCDSEADVIRFYEGLIEGGKSIMKPGKSFFARNYASLVDAFGIHWQFMFI